MLSIVALPIGNTQDITLRALDALKTSDLIIGEERKELFPLLKEIGIDIHSKKFEFLNEHSKTDDIEFLKNICKEQNVCLVSDCGTPVFCDPGSRLIAACRKENIPMQTMPGASSLMSLLSLSSQKIEKFYFYGFLPRDKDERTKEIQRISKMKEAVVVMDTPYRIKSTLEQLAQHMPNRRALLACDITMKNELILEDSLQKIYQKLNNDSREFILLLY